MAFWPTFFHRSDADYSLARSLRGLRENVVAMKVVLGNEGTENSVVHDVKVLKNDAEMDKEQDRQFVSRMDSINPIQGRGGAHCAPQVKFLKYLKNALR